MYILSLRSTRWFLVVLAVLIFAGLLGLGLYEPLVSYERENISFWSWEEVALNRSYGPQGFAVSLDGKRIALADTYNGRIILLEEGRQEQFAFSPEPVLSSLAFDRQGNLYALSFGTNMVLSVETMEWIELSKSEGTHPYYQAENIEVGKRIYVKQVFISDEVYEVSLVAYDEEERVLHRAQLEEGGSLLVGPTETVQRPVNSFTIDLQDNIYLETKGRDVFSRDITVLGSSGEKKVSFSYQSAEYIRDCSILGVDDGGNIYLAINPGRSSGQILILSKKGEVLYVIPVAWSEEHVLGEYGAVDKEGNIYFLVTNQEGIYLEKLTAQRQWVKK